MQLTLTQSPSLLQGSPFLSLQPPAPLQMLVSLHTGESSVWSRGIFAHVPIVAAKLQDLHVVLHPLLQQTPSMQKPLLHSLFAAHAPPLHFLHFAPPQSTSTSSPFIMVSLHEMHVP